MNISFRFVFVVAVVVGFAGGAIVFALGLGAYCCFVCSFVVQYLLDVCERSSVPIAAHNSQSCFPYEITRFVSFQFIWLSTWV